MASLPKLNITDVHMAHNDGAHNAFTDLCRFEDRFYLTFRSCPDGHGVFATSSIVVMTSDDAVAWREVYRFSVAGRDVRDPHFLTLGQRLLVYTGTWACDFTPPEERELNHHLGYTAYSDDGASWTGPVMLEGTYGHYIWRAATDGRRAYLCGRRKKGFVRTASRQAGFELVQCALLESEDGLVWHTAGLFQEEFGDETAFLMESDGSVMALCRTLGNRPAQVCRSKPPYRSWTRSGIDHYIGGPMLARWGDLYLVGGRRLRGTDGRTVLWWLENDQTVEAAELPSGGDNSYPGFVALDDRRGVLSFYSSHEGSGNSTAPSAIYVATLERSS